MVGWERLGRQGVFIMPCYFDPVPSPPRQGITIPTVPRSPKYSQPYRSRITSLPPAANRTVTNQLSASSPGPPQNNSLAMSDRKCWRHIHIDIPPVRPRHKTAPCPATKQTRYNLSILPSKHTTAAVIIYNLQAPTSIDNPSIRHTVTKQTRHPPPPPVQKQEPDMCLDYTLNITSRADHDHIISRL